MSQFDSTHHSSLITYLGSYYRVHHPADADHLLHVVNPHDVSAVHYADCYRRAGPLHTIVHRQPEREPDERLSRGAHQDRPAERFQLSLAAHHDDVVLRGLAEADSRVDDDIFQLYSVLERH